MTEKDALYREIQPDLDRIASPLFEFAREQVTKRGAYLPFGSTLNRQGETSMEAATSGAELESSIDVLPLLHEGLRAIAARGDVRAVAVCEWVKISPAGQPRTDAIKVLVEHERGLAVALYVPCKKPFLRRWQFGNMIALLVPAEVRPWESK